jgi:hypothetical protein
MTSDARAEFASMVDKILFSRSPNIQVNKTRAELLWMLKLLADIEQGNLQWPDDQIQLLNKLMNDEDRLIKNHETFLDFNVMSFINEKLVILCPFIALQQKFKEYKTERQISPSIVDKVLPIVENTHDFITLISSNKVAEVRQRLFTCIASSLFPSRIICNQDNYLIKQEMHGKFINVVFPNRAAIITVLDELFPDISVKTDCLVILKMNQGIRDLLNREGGFFYDNQGGCQLLNATQSECDPPEMLNGRSAKRQKLNAPGFFDSHRIEMNQDQAGQRALQF